MKQKDHLALAYYLIDCAGEGLPWRRTWHRRFFLLGCVCPDYVPFTYLRGFRQSHAARGHDARYLEGYIQKKLGRIAARGVKRWRDALALGLLMHYLADSFTFVHTGGFCGSMREHRRYEWGLHACFSKCLSHTTQREPTRPADFAQLSERLRQRRRAYECKGGEYERDCEQILGACTEVFFALCGSN